MEELTFEKKKKKKFKFKPVRVKFHETIMLKGHPKESYINIEYYETQYPT